MNPAALAQQRPQQGRSRFSKALPAPPPLLDTSSFGLPLNPRSPLSPAPPSSTTPVQNQQQQAPKRADQDYSKPLDSPLPPLPLVTPTKMTIPRKPIGLPISPMPPGRMKPFRPPQREKEAPLPPPPKKDDDHDKEALDGEVHSPAFSFSSLLSAYTATSTNSVVRSDSEDDSRATSTRNSDTSVSPKQGESASDDNSVTAQGRQQAKFPPRKDSRSYKTSVSSFPAGLTSVPKDKSLPAPPPPRHDSLSQLPQRPETSQQQKQQQKLLPQPEEDEQEKVSGQVPAQASSADAGVGVVHVQANPGPFSLLGPKGASSSPPRPELWRRRSTKTDKNLALPELKLETTNGSTASLQRSAPAPSHQVGEQAAVSAQLPRSSNALPGRSIRPIATRPAPAPPVQNQNTLPIRLPGADDQMGQSTSRIRRKSLGPGSAAVATRSNASSPNKPIQPNVEMAARPPTPEYQKNDVRSPIVDTVMSPASPASSPEPNQKAPRAPPIPKQSTRRRPVGSPASPTAVSPTAVSMAPPPVYSTPVFTVSPASPVPVAALPTPEDATASTQKETEEAATREVEDIERPATQQQPASAGPALTPHMAVVMAAVHGQPMPELPIHVSQPSAEDGNLQAGEQMQRSAGKQPGSHVYTGIPMAPGTVVDAAPLTIVHYQCFKHHKHFRQSPNTNCPLACQTCHKRDTEMRWRCNWCALRICRTCLDTLVASNRDLRLMIEKISRVKDQILVLEGEHEFGGSMNINNGAMTGSTENFAYPRSAAAPILAR